METTALIQADVAWLCVCHIKRIDVILVFVVLAEDCGAVEKTEDSTESPSDHKGAVNNILEDLCIYLVLQSTHQPWPGSDRPLAVLSFISNKRYLLLC